MFVVYNTQSIRITATCTSMRSAKGSATKATKRTGTLHVATTRENYDNNVNVWTTTYNMMDDERKPIPIRLADKGGCCDPATETYHSM